MNNATRNKGFTEVTPGHWVANGKTLVEYYRRKAARKNFERKANTNFALYGIKVR